MKKTFTLLVLIFLGVNVFAQMDINAFNATGAGYATTRLTDYQCLGVNPANLGWKWNNNSVNLGFLETGLSIHTNALTHKQVVNDLFDGSKELTMAERVKAASDFTDKRLWGQLGVTWLGLSYQNEKLGGLAFSIRERGMWNTKFNSAAARFTFLGFHDNTYFDSIVISGKDTTGYATHPITANTVYKGTSMAFIWYREYNLGYGRKIISNDDYELSGGIGLKYLIGFGSLQYLQSGSTIDAYSALSPIFKVNYNTPTPSQVNGTGLKKVGDGFGLDLGATFTYKKTIKASLAITDIGSINWNGNVYEGQEVKVWKITTGGIHNYNIFQEGQLINTDNAPDDPGKWLGVASRKVGLPTTMRLGASYKVIPKLEIGTDLMMPMKKNVPGAYSGSLFALGAVYDPTKWIQLSMGLVTGSDIGFNVPFGVSFFPAHDDDTYWTVGFAVRDISTFMKQKGPTASIAFGFLRFSFGR